MAYDVNDPFEMTPTSSTGLLRRLNAQEVLRLAWQTGAFTATDMITRTGLTRSTVIGVCDDLLKAGWLVELENQRELGGDYVKGRPARRYELNTGVACVVGVDAGEHSITVLVADLRGAVLVTRVVPVIHTRADADIRRRDIVSAIDAALLDAARRDAALLDAALRGMASHDEAPRVVGDATRAVLAVAVGVPAPTDARGEAPVSRDPFWNHMNPGLTGLFDDRGWRTLVDNDANLAALAEGWQGAGVGVSNYVTMLSGERLGSGIVIDGRLLRGGRGGAGEMNFLDLVEGVGSAAGLGSLARQWSGRAAIDVLRSAETGDPQAVEVVERLAQRFARIFSALANLLDTETIIVSGAVASSVSDLLHRASELLPELVAAAPPRLVASSLAERAVSLGAVRKALTVVQQNALDTVLPVAAMPPIAGLVAHA